jgi:hypothetical protein
MTGWHYTPFKFLPSIRRDGLVPYPIRHGDVLLHVPGNTLNAVWTWRERMTGDAHYGQVVHRCIDHRTWRMLLLEYDYEESECFIEPWDGSTKPISVRHSGDLASSNGIRWVYHREVPVHLVVVPIAPGRLRVVGDYDLSSFFDSRLDCTPLSGYDGGA